MGSINVFVYQIRANSASSPRHNSDLKTSQYSTAKLVGNVEMLAIHLPYANASVTPVLVYELE